LEEKALSLLEQSFTDFLKGKIKQDKLCKNIGIALSSLPFEGGRKKFNVEITKTNTNAEFFGMRVFPSLNENASVCNRLAATEDVDSKLIRYQDLIKIWKKIPEWNLELDSACFDRNGISFTPRELVAMLIHEIGHVIYSETPVEIFYRAFKENQTRLKLADKATQKAMYMIYMLPLSIACSQRRWINGKNELHVEIVADRTVADFGYGEDLLNALDKIIRNVGSVNTDENRQYAEVNSSVEWCNRNVVDVYKRRETLKDELFFQAVKNKSNYIKAVAIFAIDKIGFNLREKYNGVAIEATLEIVTDPDFLVNYDLTENALETARFFKLVDFYRKGAEATLESVLNKRKKVKAILPSQYEIDAIAVEVDNIQNHSDRIFVLDLIYNLLERINLFEEAISPDPALVRRWQDTIDLMKTELQTYRKATLEKKTFNKSNYHLFVKLPPQAADYEG
jgi:hypothetical protein